MASPILGRRQRLLSTCARGCESLSHLMSWNPVSGPFRLFLSLSISLPTSFKIFSQKGTNWGSVADRAASANLSIGCERIGDGAALGRLHHGPALPGRRRGGEVLRHRGHAFSASHQDTSFDRLRRGISTLHHALSRRDEGADRRTPLVRPRGLWGG